MRKIALGIAAVAAASAAPALAGTSTGDMQVQVSVINSCTVAASPMNFGSPTGIGTANIDRTSTVALVCTNGSPYNVAMDLGDHASGSQRRMSNGAATPTFVPYGIYTDNTYATAWDDSNTISGSAPVSGVVNLTAYGRIPASASSVGAGVYTDTVTVTVTF